MNNRKKYMKQWKKEHPTYSKEWYLKHREESIKRNKKWRLENKEYFIESQKKYREEHKKEIKLLKSEWYLKNKEKSMKRNKIWTKLNPDKRRNTALKSLFGITLEEYNKMFKSQNGVCAICGKSETEIDKRINKKRNLSVDHNHKTNKVRGLLCGKCNKMLGLSNDNKQILINAIKYLTKE
jgi:hypothetical protein